MLISYLLGETLQRTIRPDLSIIPVFMPVGRNWLDFLSSVVGVFLWPLVSSHSLGSWLKPVLQKLDFGVGEFLQKVKENHGKGGPPQPSVHSRMVLITMVFVSERRLSQAQREQQNVDSDLSSMFPKVSEGRQSDEAQTQTQTQTLPSGTSGAFSCFISAVEMIH